MSEKRATSLPASVRTISQSNANNGADDASFEYELQGTHFAVLQTKQTLGKGKAHIIFGKSVWKVVSTKLFVSQQKAFESRLEYEA
jgi:hypothetical protein